MTTISMRIEEADAELIKRYAKFNGQTLSDFIKESVLERIEDEHDLKDLREAIAESDGTSYSMKEVKEELGF